MRVLTHRRMDCRMRHVSAAHLARRALRLICLSGLSSRQSRLALLCPICPSICSRRSALLFLICQSMCSSRRCRSAPLVSLRAPSRVRLASAHLAPALVALWLSALSRSRARRVLRRNVSRAPEPNIQCKAAYEPTRPVRPMLASTASFGL